MGQFSLLPQDDLDELLRPTSLGFLHDTKQPPVKTTVENYTDQQGLTDQRVTQVSESLPQAPADDSKGTGNAWTLLTDMDDREKEILAYATEEANKLRQMDGVLGTNRGDALMTKVLQRLKLERTNAEDTADRLIAQDFYTDESFPKIIQDAANQGATIEQMGKLSTAYHANNPSMGQTMQQAMFIAQQSWDALPEEEKLNQWKAGVSQGQFVNRKAAELMSSWQSTPESVIEINEAKVETTSLIDINKKINEEIFQLYFDKNQLYSNALIDNQRIDHAINLLESGQLQTGPITRPYMMAKRFFDQAFAGGSDQQREIIGNQKKRFSGLKDMLVRDAEFFDSLATLLGARNIQLTKGNVTEREMMMFLKIAPELSKSPKGNMDLLRILKNINLKILDYKKAAYRYFNEILPETGKPRGWPDVPTEFAQWMIMQPEVAKWENFDTEGPSAGVGGIIPRDAYVTYTELNKPKEGIPANIGAYSVIPEPQGEKGMWGNEDILTPFTYDGKWWIVKDGLLYEVTLN